MVTQLTLANLQAPATAENYNDAELAIAALFGLPTTSWETGQPERTIFATNAIVQQQSDIAGSLIIQAGFLDFAATGSVTYTDQSGATVTLLVTPDPSIPAQNPSGALGWLDVLADSVYNVQRILVAFAGGQLAILNTSVSTYGPFTATTYHVSQPDASGSPTYSNTTDLTIAPSSLGATVSTMADSGSGLIEVTTVAAHPFATDAPVFITGVFGTIEANGAWIITRIDATHFTLNNSAFVNPYDHGGKVYAPAVSTFQADVAGTPSNAETPNVVNHPITSLIGVSVANLAPWIGTDTESNLALAARCRLKLASLAIGGPGGAYAYFALLAQQLAPTLTPPLVVGAQVTRVLVTLDKTQGLVSVTCANAGGGCSGDINTPGTDVFAIQAVLAAYVGITNFTAIAQGAANHAIAVSLTVFVPAAFNTTTNRNYFRTAVLNYFKALAIGGVTDPGGNAPSTNVVPYDAVLGSVFTAGALASIPVQTVEGTLAGGTSNVQLLLTPVPEVAVPTVTITLTSV